MPIGRQVRVESAPADAKRYANLAFGTMQGTGGSSAMANSWMQLREAGAKARAMLLTAAASDWHVPAVGTDGRERRRLPRGDQARRRLSARWSKPRRHCPCPTRSRSRTRRTSSSSATRPPRVDVPAKIDGTAQFTLDVVLPGMLVALLKRPPQFGATVKILRCGRSQRRAGRGQSRAGAARRRGGREEFLGGQARTRRAAESNGTTANAEKRSSARSDG